MIGFGGQVIQKPLVLQKGIGNILYNIQHLERGSGVDLAGTVRDALVEQAYAPLRSGSDDPSADSRVISCIAEWYLRNIIHDTGNLGVCFSVSRSDPEKIAV